jgi:hypothetical protein
MKRVLLAILILFAGLIAGLAAGLLLPPDQRLRLSRQLQDTIGGLVEQVPDG